MSQPLRPFSLKRWLQPRRLQWQEPAALDAVGAWPREFCRARRTVRLFRCRSLWSRVGSASLCSREVWGLATWYSSGLGAQFCRFPILCSGLNLVLPVGHYHWLGNCNRANTELHWKVKVYRPIPPCRAIPWQDNSIRMVHSHRAGVTVDSLDSCWRC